MDDQTGSPQTIGDGTAAQPSSRPPYPGLRPFERGDADLFFGRDEEAEAILDRLEEHRLVAVLGGSGSGKSSLVRAAVIPQLVGGFNAIGSQWIIATCTPGDAPLRRLAEALGPVGALEGGKGDIGALEAWIRRGPRAILEWCEAGNLLDGQHLLILVDQFEELFNYGRNASTGEAWALASLLVESVQSTRSEAAKRIYVILTMRSKYFGACGAYPDLADAVSEGLFLVPRMMREACTRAIVGPARITGCTVAPTLVTRLLNDLEAFATFSADTAGGSAQVGQQADQLPLMQYALNSLWRKAGARKGVVLTLDDYRKINFLEGALDVSAVWVIEADGSPGERAIGRVYRALVKGQTAALAVRDPHTVAEIAAISGLPEVGVGWIVTAFAADKSQFLAVRPAIRPDAPIGPDSWVDIAHESLIRRWTRLAVWLKMEADAADTWTQLAREAGAGHLLEGAILADRRRWWQEEKPSEAWTARYAVAVRGATVTAAAAEAFLDRSVARRWRRLLRGAGALASVAGVMGLVVWVAFALSTDAPPILEPLVKLRYLGHVKSATDLPKPGPEAVFQDCAKQSADCPKMVVVPGGEFLMGSKEKDLYQLAGPQHPVRVKSFAVSQTDITFDEWDACHHGGGCNEGVNADYGRGTKPLINVSWAEAKEYARWLARMTGKTYRLLSEAEWEYAARAGTTTAYYDGDTGSKLRQYAWIDANSEGPREGPRAVENGPPNAFGLYDMYGNVSVWVEDAYHDSYQGAPDDGRAWEETSSSERVLRGCSWRDKLPEVCRSAFRRKDTISHRNDISGLGLRLARTL